MNYVLTDIDGKIYSITDVDGLMGEMSIEDIIAFYKCSKAYYDIHSTLKSLVDKGLMYEPRQPYPFAEIQNTLDIFKTRIVDTLGLDAFIIIDNEIQDASKDGKFIHALGENIMKHYNYKPSVQTLIQAKKNPNFLTDL